MRIILFSLMCWSVSLSSKPAYAVDQPETILFLGDSITRAGGYVRVIEAEFKKTDPDHAPAVVNRGKSSETVSGLSEEYHPGRRPYLFDRLDQQLAEVKPDWVVACYGINCGIYHPFDEQRFKAYQEGIAKLISVVHASGAKLILMTAPPYAKAGPAFADDLTDEQIVKLLEEHNAKANQEAEQDPRKYGYRSPYAYYDKIMAHYAEWLLTLNGQENVWVVDLRTPMLPHISKTHGKDPIHPNAYGHELMAKAFLQKWATIHAKSKAE
jgi:lysophospholipase L1-like esterase